MPLINNYADFLASLNSAKFRVLWPGQDYILVQYGAFEDPGKPRIGQEHVPPDRVPRKRRHIDLQQQEIGCR